MNYAPHRIYRRVDQERQYDEHGRSIPDDESVVWEFIGECRHDYRTTDYRTTENGQTYDIKHHIVCEGKVLRDGDYIKCEDKTTGALICEGKIAQSQPNNYFNRTDLYL